MLSAAHATGTDDSPCSGARGHAPRLSSAARDIAKRLRAAGHEVLFAGGCVRDGMLRRPVSDIDIATSALPEQVQALFPRSVAVGKSFGVIQVLTKDDAFDVATFRADPGIGNGRHPPGVRFTTVEEDAQRRDFTINGLFEDPETGAVLDYVGGQADLAEGVVRAIGDPCERFREDHLRMLRAIRFAATLEFRIEPATAAAVRSLAPLLARVSGERQGVELRRLLTEALHPGKALRLMRSLGLLDVLLPEVAAMHATVQPPRYHPEGDALVHTCLMLDALPPPPRDALLTWAVLLHDIGKPPTALWSTAHNPPGWRFPNHANVGADMAVDVMKRLRQPASTIRDLCSIVRRHMTFPDTPNMRRARLRRFMGTPTFQRELELHRLDCRFSSGERAIEKFLESQLATMTAEPVLPEPWVKGRDLLALGMPPGPEMGDRLRAAYDAQLEGIFTDRDSLLAHIADCEKTLLRTARRNATA